MNNNVGSLTNFTVLATAITEEQIQKNRNRIIGMLRSINRPGIPELLQALDSSDFYVAPASTRFHNSYKGGLAEHSLNVRYCLQHICSANETAFPPNIFPRYDADTITIASLLHDAAKIGFYKPILRNQKVYRSDGTKWDAGGHYEWDQVVSYEVENSTPLEHGEQSKDFAMRYIQLTDAEKYAIRWHMGFTEPNDNYGYIRDTFELYRLALALHAADMEATYYLEGRPALG